jgi:hypothetical protein
VKTVLPTAEKLCWRMRKSAKHFWEAEFGLFY